ncbi:MAG: methionyl-tRNA formyltransferase [Clostridiales bacterium]|nr:methionyl-tRNA formyltransferase [Clostridiales bacterium]
MKVIFFGTPEYAVPSLRRLTEEHEVVAVVTQPDKPKGRGGAVSCSPVKLFALEKKIPVLQPERARNKSFAETLSGFRADIFVVTAYGQILPQRLLSMPRFGAINEHGSLLPKYRGASPIQQAIIHGDKVTGVTIMQMDSGIDTGDMLLKKELEISDSDTYGTLHDKLALLSAEAIIEVLPMIEQQKIVPIKQDDSLSSYAPLITKQDAVIDWQKSSGEIVNLIRGMNPSPCAYSHLNGTTVKIWAAVESVKNSADLSAGTVLCISKSGIEVAAGVGTVLVTGLQAEGSRRMNAFDFANGRRIASGAKFASLAD